jgi:hypothetical protein
MPETYLVGDAHPTGTTGLKMWAFRTLKNTISNILSEIFTHSFSPVTPLRGILYLITPTYLIKIYEYARFYIHRLNLRQDAIEPC